MKSRLFTSFGVAVFSLLPTFTLAVPFLSSDFSVTVRVQAAAGGVPVDRTTTVNTGAFSDNASDASARSSATAFGSGGLTLGAITEAGSTGFGGSAVTQVTVVNHFMVIPNAGFTGTTATVSLPFFLHGLLSVGGNVGLPGCADGSGICGNGEANVLASLTVPTASWTGDSSDSIQRNVVTPVGGTLGVGENGMLTGTVPVNTSIAVEIFLQTQATAQAFNFISQVASKANFASTLSYGGMSPDDVTFDWASNQFFRQPPQVEVAQTPAPGSVALVFAGLFAGAVALRRRSSSKSRAARHR